MCTNVFFYISVVFFMLQEGECGESYVLVSWTTKKTPWTILKAKNKWLWMNHIAPGLSYQLQEELHSRTTEQHNYRALVCLSPACCSRTTREQQSLQICLCCVVFAIGYIPEISNFCGWMNRAFPIVFKISQCC